METVLILAGGLSTRLRKFTENLPKSLVEVAGEPFIAHQLSELSRQGIKKVVICIGHLGEQIEEFVGNGSMFGLEVRYAREKEKLLGTGGAIRNALPLLEESFFILYGDSWLNIDYYEVWKAYKKSNCPALISIFLNKNHWDKSNVEMVGDSIKLYSKKNLNKRMTHIDYGLGVMNCSILESYPKGLKFDLSDIYEKLSLNGQLAKFETTKRFYEIGSPSGLKELKNYLSS